MAAMLDRQSQAPISAVFFSPNPRRTGFQSAPPESIDEIVPRFRIRTLTANHLPLRHGPTPRCSPASAWRTAHRVTRSILVILLKYAVGVAILAAVVARNWNVVDNGQQVGLSVLLERSIDVRAFGLGLACFTTAIAINFFRWSILVRAQDLPISPRDVLRLGLVGFFFNNFLPGTVSGDLVKVAFLMREQNRRTAAIATVLLDRIIGLTGLFWVATLFGGTLFLTGRFDGLLADSAARLTIQTILALCGAVVVGTLVAWLGLGLVSSAWLDRVESRLDASGRIQRTLAEILRATRVYRRQGRFVAVALGLSVVGQFLQVIAFYQAAVTVNDIADVPPFLVHLVIVPIGSTIRSLIPLPGGMGGAELGYGKLYQLVGFPFSSGVLASLGQLAMTWLLGVVAFVMYQAMDWRRR